MWIRDSSVVLYKSDNNEIDHITSIFIIVCLLFFVWSWLRWSRNIYTDVASAEDRAALWTKTTVIYIQLVTSVLLLILTRNLWAQAQGSHGLYNLETIDIIGYAWCFRRAVLGGYVDSGGTCAGLIAFESYRRGTRTYSHPRWF